MRGVLNPGRRHKRSRRRFARNDNTRAKCFVTSPNVATIAAARARGGGNYLCSPALSATPLCRLNEQRTAQ